MSCFLLLFLLNIIFLSFNFILVQLSEAEKKRQNLIDELFATETTYVENLKLVYEVSFYFNLPNFSDN